MAWWLAYEELYGDMDKEYPIMTKEYADGHDDVHPEKSVTLLGGSGEDSLSFRDQSYWDDDGFSVTGNPFASPDTITFGESDQGTLSITGSRLPGAMGEDHISFDVGGGNTAYNSYEYYARDFGDDPYSTLGSMDDVYKYHFPGTETTKPQPDLTSEQTQKYGEDKGIADLKDYVSSTYSGHYTSTNNNVQTLDLIQSVGDAESFCRSNAIKYLSRYDKKGQAKRDILKAMHYCLLLYYFSGHANENDETPTRGYETF